MDIRAYNTYWASNGFEPNQEHAAVLKDLVDKKDLPFDRSHTDPGHWTGSAFVWDPKEQKLLLMHHRKLDKWLQPGGHADGDTNLERVAQKETDEETGIQVKNPVSWPDEMNVFDIDIHKIPARKNEPTHLHFDVRYLFLADSQQAPVQNEESHEVKWFKIEELLEITKEESILRPIRKIQCGGWL